MSPVDVMCCTSHLFVYLHHPCGSAGEKLFAGSGGSSSSTSIIFYRSLAAEPRPHNLMAMGLTPVFALWPVNSCAAAALTQVVHIHFVTRSLRPPPESAPTRSWGPSANPRESWEEKLSRTSSSIPCSNRSAETSAAGFVVVFPPRNCYHALNVKSS